MNNIEFYPEAKKVLPANFELLNFGEEMKPTHYYWAHPGKWIKRGEGFTDNGQPFTKSYRPVARKIRLATKKDLSKKFVYEISWKDLSHTPATNKELYGTNFFNPDFGIDIHARESINNLFQDAITHCMLFKMKNMAQKPQTKEGKQSQTRQIKYYDKKIKLYETIRDSIKLLRME